GAYKIAFKAANRANSGGTQSFDVKMDGTTINSFTTTSTSYSDYSTAQFDLTSGSHTVTFAGATTSGDNTSFIDDITLKPLTPPSGVPTRSDDALVTTYSYNSAGWVGSSFDPRNIESRTIYDMLGRKTQTIGDYVDGTPSSNDDQTTSYTYDGDNHVLTMKAVLPGTSVFQET